MIMPYRPDNAMPQVRGRSAVLRNLIRLYLVASVASIGLLLLGGVPIAGTLLVLFALPWSLLLTLLARSMAWDSAALNLALLAIGIGLNAALLDLLRRWHERQPSSQSPN
jgi:hypothetical protein